MIGRKRMPPALAEPWAVFQAQAERVEQARVALLGCLPVGRVEPAPVPVGLDLLADELRSVAPELERWRVPEMEAEWAACAASITEALAEIERARAIAAATDEAGVLAELVAEVVGALDCWHDAERRWLALRVRPSPRDRRSSD